MKFGTMFGGLITARCERCETFICFPDFSCSTTVIQYLYISKFVFVDITSNVDKRNQCSTKSFTTCTIIFAGCADNSKLFCISDTLQIQKLYYILTLIKAELIFNNYLKLKKKKISTILQHPVLEWMKIVNPYLLFNVKT